METPLEYLCRTRSAVEHLFNGIDAYHAILRRSRPPVLAGTFSCQAEHDIEVARWISENSEEIQRGLSAERAFLAEKYALAVLCGSLLHIASKAIQLYSGQSQVPSEFASFVSSTHASFCIGREVRGVPLGLVILAGRNQYNHLEDDHLREPSSTVFERLATQHCYGADVRDPAFDLAARLVWNYACNVTSLIGWQYYESYEKDMRSLLGV